MTVVKHSIEAENLVNSGYQEHGAYSQKIVYKANLDQIKHLKARVYDCRQFIEYKCKGARLLNWYSTTRLNNFLPSGFFHLLLIC